MPEVSLAQFPVASHPDVTYTVETNDTSHQQFHPNITGREEYANIARPRLAFTAVVATTRLQAAKGMRPQTTYE